ncbi:MAG: M23 family metallopeptidase [Prevotellaceae bacterium]|jgi:murein DD-endopeptidase MepM/ murein hydrolase activator NlpD|nr:M23 family metallopeptidase [Prevotellaceae bacterium]
MPKEYYQDTKKRQGKLKHKYRFSAYNDESLKQLWHIRLSGIEAWTLVGSIIAAIIALVVVMIAFTPLRELIPGYPNNNTRREIVQNALRADSLEMMMYKWELHLANINRIVSGKDPVPIESALIDSVRRGRTRIRSHSKEDSLLRLEVEREVQFHVSSLESNRQNGLQLQPLESVHFFAPVKGAVTDKFDMLKEHFAVDIVARPNAVVSSTLDGTVVMAAWTSETGYVIQLQHKNNIISTYKHNAKLLKKTGEAVKAGEAIAIVGNSGELTTGPHLHFELWYNGYPVDPEKYISF